MRYARLTMMVRFALMLIPALAGAAPAPTAAPRPKPPQIKAVNRVMRDCVASREIAGAVTIVATRDKILHQGTAGLADIAAGKPMRPDAIFWIASMSKLVTASAVMMLQDEGKLSVEDPVAKYLPELADVKTADGKPGNLTLRHLLTHTSGLAEASEAQSLAARKLADLIPCYAKKPLQFAPGSQWLYSQSGINSLSRIVEVVSGQSFEKFLQQRLLGPLGMKDTTFSLTPAQAARIAKSYRLVDGRLEEVAILPIYDYKRAHPCPLGNGGLYSTAMDYVRFCQMILNEGSLDGKQYLKPATVRQMTGLQTGDLKAGFTSGCGWGLGWVVVRQPQGPTAMLSPGTFGHGGAYGTQAWIDPVKQVIYVMMVQRSNFKNADASDARRRFQAAAAAALK